MALAKSENTLQEPRKNCPREQVDRVKHYLDHLLYEFRLEPNREASRNEWSDLMWEAQKLAIPFASSVEGKSFVGSVMPYLKQFQDHLAVASNALKDQDKNSNDATADALKSFQMARRVIDGLSNAPALAKWLTQSGALEPIPAQYRSVIWERILTSRDQLSNNSNNHPVDSTAIDNDSRNLFLRSLFAYAADHSLWIPPVQADIIRVCSNAITAMPPGSAYRAVERRRNVLLDLFQGKSESLVSV